MINQDHIDPENFAVATVGEAVTDPPDGQQVGILCGRCGVPLQAGERVVVFLDGDLAEHGGLTDVRAHETHHYECFFPEEIG